MALAVHRRSLLGLAAGLACPAPALAAVTDQDLADWRNFRSRFLAPDGRVVDTGNQNVSHTEGQGWGMLAAVRCDDRASFNLMLNWTRRTLRRRQDMLHAWRYQPAAANPVADQNNATDGDLCLAWALLEAGRRWGDPEHAELGTAITRDVLRLLVRRVGGLQVLLPGARGFEKRDHVVLNPSYYVFPAFRVLAQAVPDPAWVRVAADGLALLRAGRFGRWGLPPDWVALSRTDASLSLASNFAPRFSYDAVRVPLYLAWARLAGEPALAGAAGFWSDPGHNYLPAWTDLTSNAISPYPASPGIVGIARLAAMQRAGTVSAGGAPPPVAAAPDYYSAALALLVRIAWREAAQI